jgi:expansin (peptidoglycan-binding protein)
MVSGRHRPSKGRWTLLRLGLGGGAILAAVIAVAVGMSQVAGVRACAAVLSAAGGSGQIATHYVLQGGGGNCSYPGPPADNLYVALSPSEYDSAAPCGSYLEVNGPDGSVRVKVVDQCPECATGHIDLSATAFARIAPLSAGLISVSYQTIANPPLPGPLSFVVKTGSSQYWLALVVMNTGNAVASVQVESASGGWLNLTRTNWDGWIAQSGAGPGPFTIRVTDTLGHQATVGGIALNPGAVQGTGSDMYGAGSSPAPPPATTPPATPAATTPAASPSRSPASSPAARRKHPSASPTPTVLRSLSAQVASDPPATRAIDPQTAVATPTC